MIQHTPWKSKGILRCFFQVKSNYELTKYQVDTRRSSCQRCCKMLQDGDARMKAIALPRSVQSPNVIFYRCRNLCENWESPCTIMYHHVPNKCFWIAFPPKKNWHGSWKSLFERKIKSSSKPIFGFHVSFTGGVDILVGIVKFNFVAWNSTPSNGRQSTGLEKKGKTPTFHDRLILEGWMDVKYLRLRGDFEGM